MPLIALWRGIIASLTFAWVAVLTAGVVLWAIPLAGLWILAGCPVNTSTKPVTTLFNTPRLTEKEWDKIMGKGN